MPLTAQQQDAVLKAARALIGTSYDKLDCSHFVHRAYFNADLKYPYRSTSAFTDLLTEYFDKLPSTQETELQPGDVLMFPGHMGLWDPAGCKVLQDAGTSNAECKRFDNSLTFLSSRSGNNRGPDYGLMKWYGELQAAYRWKATTSK